MVGRLFLKGSERVFEAGTGTGYQTAILARLCAHVVTVELSPERTKAAKTRLDVLGITNVTFITGDAAHGAPDLGPFDRMIYGAALSGQVDQHLIDQIAPRGGLLAPIGQYQQETRMIEGDLLEVRKDKEGNVTQKINPIFGGTLTFVPLISRRSIGWTSTKEGGCVPSSDNSNR